MKRLPAYLLSFVVLALLALLLAQPLTAVPAQAKPERVKIVTDQVAGAATITIDGVPVLRVDKTGIRVSGSVAYSGRLADEPFSAEVRDAR